jgi:endonuclease/exonuclease/phosphatase family metal-dependent hydrolase
MFRKSSVFLCLLLLAVTAGFAAGPATISVMTQNMDDGTDLTFAIAELFGIFPPGVGVELTYQEVLATDIPDRIGLLASRVAAKKPDLLAVQEATLWRVGASVNAANTVLFDQLQLLQRNLAAAGAPYEIVAVNSLKDIALPKASGGALRITDRNALLIRADLRPPELHLSDVHAETFDAQYSLGGITVPSGWISAIVHSGNRRFRLFTTHLQSPIPGDATASAVQVQQAKQLLREARDSTVPVVIAGDFNSDAILGTAGPGPDNTATVSLIQAGGYTDTWSIAGSGLGPTWPLFLEDLYPPPFFAPATPFERIDIIFEQGLSVVSVEQVLAPGPVQNQWPLFGSDHAGVLAAFRF